MSGDVHVRFCEGLRGRFPRATRLIVTGKSKRLLEDQVKPAVEAFLTERGLSLSEEKTMITHITDGFTFLGQTFRKTGNVLHITPAKKGVLALKEKLSELIHKHVGGPLEPLVKKLNQTLRGWGNYHRHVVSSETFSLIDTFIISGVDGIKRTHGYSLRYQPGNTAKSKLHEVNSRGVPQGRPL